MNNLTGSFPRNVLRAYLDHAGVIFVVIGRDERVLLINKSGWEMLGYSDEQSVVGKKWFTHFIPARQRKPVRDVFKKMITGTVRPEINPVENVVLTKQGKERVIRWYNTVLCEEHRVIATVSTGADITEQKLVEISLRDSEEKFRMLAEEITEGIVVAVDARNYWVNEAFCTIFGYRREELVGKPVDFLVVPRDAAILRDSMRRGLRGDEAPAMYEVQARKKDGSLITLRVQAKKTVFDHKKAFLVVVTDITKHKKAEQIQREYQHLLEYSEKEAKEFSRRMLHIREQEHKQIAMDLHDEIGGLVMGLGAQLNLAEQELNKGHSQKAQEYIRQTKQYLHTIAARVRRIAHTLTPVTLELVGLSVSLRQLFNDFRKSSGVKGFCEIALDETKLQQENKIVVYRVAQEALHNIAKHARAQKVIFLCRQRNDRIEMAVKDNGKGFQLQKIMGQGLKGSMGIHGMKERVGSVGGSFLIDSMPGRGTRIQVSIPAGEG